MFTIQQPKKNGIKPILSLVFIESVHVFNNSLDSLVKLFGKNDFYYLSQVFSANVLDLLKKGFFLRNTRIALKNSKRDYLTKINFLIHYLILQLVIKIVNMFLTFGKLLWILRKIIMICT